MLPPLKIGDLDAREFSATKRAGKADQQQRPIAQPWQVVDDRLNNFAQDHDFGGELRPGALARLLREPVEAREGLRDLRSRRRGRASG